jgi:hypothetical protein
MKPFRLDDAILDAPVRGSANLGDASTLRDALGNRPTLVAFVRHFG